MLDRFENEPPPVPDPVGEEQQPSLFGPYGAARAAAAERDSASAAGAAMRRESELVERLREVEPERMTPLEALNLLAELVGSARSRDSC
jgi:hypothetical protein